MSDPQGPGQAGPTGGMQPPAWYTSQPVVPPPPGAPFVAPQPARSKKLKGKLATVGFVLAALAAAAYLGLSGGDGAGDERHDADSARLGTAGTGPVVGDHWHAAYGIFLCEGYAAPLADELPDPFGIHTHSDGLIHIHPFDQAHSGTGANLGAFLETIGVELTEDTLTMPDGGTFGEECGGEPARILVAVWSSPEASEPEVFSRDFDRLRFLAPDEVWTIAVVPEGGNLDKPESIETLPNPGDL